MAHRVDRMDRQRFSDTYLALPLGIIMFSWAGLLVGLAHARLASPMAWDSY